MTFARQKIVYQMRCGRIISLLLYAHVVTVCITLVASAVRQFGVRRPQQLSVQTQCIPEPVTRSYSASGAGSSYAPAIVHQTGTSHVQNLGWVDQTTPVYERFMQPMMFKEDFRPAHVAYSKGLQISRDKERINKHVISAAFKAAMCTSHLELFYREFYNNGAAWGLRFQEKDQQQGIGARNIGRVIT